MRHSFDSTDLAILGAIQQNCDGTAGDIAERVGISANACWRRMRVLQQNGTVTNRVALLHPDHLQCGQTVFVRGRAANPTAQWRTELRTATKALPHIVEVHRLAGGNDYRLKLRVPDIQTFDRVMCDLAEQIGLTVVETEFSVDEVMYTTALPFPEATN